MVFVIYDISSVVGVLVVYGVLVFVIVIIIKLIRVMWIIFYISIVGVFWKLDEKVSILLFIFGFLVVVLINLSFFEY